MRAGAVLLAGVVALVTGTVSIHGAVAASHRAAKPAFWSAGSPSWSPDGKQIVFSDVRYVQQPPYAPNPTRFRIVRTSSRPGGAIHTVYAGPRSKGEPGALGWTAGGRILFTVDTSGSLLSVSVHGGKAKGLIFPVCRSITPDTNPQCWPWAFILSPNRKIAAVKSSDFVPDAPDWITLAKVNAARPAALPTPAIAAGLRFDGAFAFSPDGKQLVYTSFPVGKPPVLMAVGIGSQKPVPLAQSGIPGAGLVPSDASQVQWSPDSRWVAFVENQSLEVAPTAGGSAPRVLATCPGLQAPAHPDFSWSPTSNVIAFEGCAGNGSGQISTVRADGTHLTDLLKDRPLADITSENAGGPQWSPDGSRLLFLAHRIGHRTIHVWTIRPNGQNLTRLG